MCSTFVHIKSYIKVVIFITSLSFLISCSAKFNSASSESDGSSGGTSATATAPSSSVTKFVITSPVSNATAGSAYIITVTAQDSSSAVVATYSGTVTLVASGSATGGGVVTITNGTGTKAITDNVAETVSLSLTDSAGTGYDVTSTASLVVEAAAASKLVYSGPTTATAGSCTSAMTITRKDTYNNLASPASAITVTLAGNGAGTYYSASDCTGEITTIGISSGQSSTASFYFKDNTAQSLTLTGASAGLTSSSSAMTVSAAAVSKLVFNTGVTSATAGACTGLIIYRKDTYDNLASPASATSITSLSGNGSGTYYSASNCTGSITTSSIASGQSSVTIYFKDTVKESLTLRADSTGITSTTLSFTVNADVADHLEYTSGNNQTADVQQSLAAGLKLIVRDRYNNGVSGVNVSFLTTENNGIFSSNLITSDASGGISATYYTGAIAKTNNIIAQTPGTTLADLAGSGNTILNFKAITTTLNAGTFNGAVSSSAANGATLIDFKLVDINRDGLLDILGINTANNTAFYKLRDSGGYFADPVEITTFDNPILSFVVGDFNYDSEVDFAVGDNTGQVIVCTGIGGNLFNINTPINTTLSQVNFIVAGNFNQHSGYIDLAVASDSFKIIKILEGSSEGIGNVVTSIDTDSTIGVNQLAAGDIDNNNMTDLIYGLKDDGNIHVMLQLSNGSFTEKVTSTSAGVGSFTSIAVVDFSSDDRPDILYVDNANGRVYHQLGIGNGYFDTEASENVTDATKITTADFNGDNRVDYIVTRPGGGRADIYSGDGGGNFSSLLSLSSASTNPTYIDVGDFNGDKKVDVVTADLDGTANAFSTFSAN